MRRKNSYLAFQLFLNRNAEKWTDEMECTCQIKIAGQNHILPPLEIAWKAKHGQISKIKLNVKLSENELNSSVFVLVVRQHERPLLH